MSCGVRRVVGVVTAWCADPRSSCHDTINSDGQIHAVTVRDAILTSFQVILTFTIRGTTEEEGLGDALDDEVVMDRDEGMDVI